MPFAQEAACEVEVPAIHTMNVRLVDGEVLTLTTPCDRPMLEWQAYSEIALQAEAHGYRGQFVAIEYVRSRAA